MSNKNNIVAVTALIKNNTGDKFFALQRNMNEKAFPGAWSIPGGKVEPGETIREAIIREVEEETGMEVLAEMDFLADYTFTRPDGINVVGITFVVKVKDENIADVPDEFLAGKWMTQDEFLKEEHIKGVEKEIEKAFA